MNSLPAFARRQQNDFASLGTGLVVWRSHPIITQEAAIVHASPTTGRVQTSLRLGVPRDTLEDDPVSNDRLVNVLLPLGVAKLAGACSGGIYFRFGRS